jgi:thiamine-monophosphate kinase
VGHKALARGLSDIAAMGATPRFCLVSLALAPECHARWVDAFYRGLTKLAARFDTALAGGDLSHADKIACDIMVCGSVRRARALRRDTARPGDGIYVSGTLGGSTLGLATGKGHAWKRHLTPEPRIALGRWLLDRRIATAAMDVTDGLSLDLQRLCLASRVAAALQTPLPIYKGATSDQALHGGEDYELLFTARAHTPVPQKWRNIPLTRIGTLVKGAPGHVTLDGSPLPPLGYDHFRA